MTAFGSKSGINSKLDVKASEPIEHSTPSADDIESDLDDLKPEEISITALISIPLILSESRADQNFNVLVSQFFFSKLHRPPKSLC